MRNNKTLRVSLSISSYILCLFLFCIYITILRAFNAQTKGLTPGNRTPMVGTPGGITVPWEPGQCLKQGVVIREEQNPLTKRRRNTRPPRPTNARKVAYRSRFKI